MSMSESREHKAQRLSELEERLDRQQRLQDAFVARHLEEDTSPFATIRKWLPAVAILVTVVWQTATLETKVTNLEATMEARVMELSKEIMQLRRELDQKSKYEDKRVNLFWEVTWPAINSEVKEHDKRIRELEQRVFRAR